MIKPASQSPAPVRQRSLYLRQLPRLLAAALVGMAVSACGGGDPLANPASVTNSTVNGGQVLSFDYFQRCVFPVVTSVQSVTLNGVTVNNTCSSAGCHDSTTGRGGAFRILPGATVSDLTQSANSPPAVRGTDMYRNFVSAQAETIVGVDLQSLLVNKPLLRNVLHGGGLIFADTTAPGIQRLIYWIDHPMPAGQDEFGTASAALFDASGGCLP